MAEMTDLSFEDECREAFRHLSTEAAALPRRGYDSERAYQAKVRAVDAVLDQWLTYCELTA